MASRLRDLSSGNHQILKAEVLDGGDGKSWLGSYVRDAKVPVATLLKTASLPASVIYLAEHDPDSGRHRISEITRDQSELAVVVRSVELRREPGPGLRDADPVSSTTQSVSMQRWRGQTLLRVGRPFTLPGIEPLGVVTAVETCLEGAYGWQMTGEERKTALPALHEATFAALEARQAPLRNNPDDLTPPFSG